MHDLAEQAGIELPAVLGKVEKTKSTEVVRQQEPDAVEVAE
jgi:hypothetical protein